MSACLYGFFKNKDGIYKKYDCKNIISFKGDDNIMRYQIIQSNYFTTRIEIDDDNKIIVTDLQNNCLYFVDKKGLITEINFNMISYKEDKKTILFETKNYIIEFSIADYSKIDKKNNGLCIYGLIATERKMS